MGHYCGAPNRTVGGSCGRWLVNYDHCADHRRALAIAGGGETVAYVDQRRVADSAGLLSQVLTDDLNAALEDLIVDYLGGGAKRSLRRRRTHKNDCQEIADAAKAVLDLKG